MTLAYLSLCDGIGAAHVASDGLGWVCRALAEIDKAPAAVTAHRRPHIKNLGDIMAPDFVARARTNGRIDAVVGGTPCQSFSIAGLRAGMADDRGNLTMRFVEICDAVGTADDGDGDGEGPVDVVFWENVDGILSDRGNAFGCFLAALVGEDTPIPAPRGGWTDAGMVVGPLRKACWRVVDAQGFVPQRRRRVFVVAARHRCGIDPSRVLLETEAEALFHLGDRAGTGPLFPEPESLPGHPAPCGGPGARASGDAATGVALRGREGGGTAELTGSVMPALRTGGGGGDKPHVLAFGGNNTGAIDVATALNAHGGPAGRMDFESETFVASVTGDITHALNTANNGKGSSEDGTGRGVPTIAYRTSGNSGAWETGDRVDALTTGTDQSSHLLAFSGKDHGADAGEISPTLRAMNSVNGNQNAGGEVAVAFAQNQRNELRDLGPAGSLSAIRRGDAKNETLLAAAMSVRRLTPRECQRLQGFPDGYDLTPMPAGRRNRKLRRIDADEAAYLAAQGAEVEQADDGTWRTTAVADGPRYKGSGNSWNVDAVRWVFQRLDAEWRRGSEMREQIT